MANHLREQYLAAVLVQDQAFFDRVGPGEVVLRASRDVEMIRTGLGERLGYLIWSLSTMTAVSLIIGKSTVKTICLSSTDSLPSALCLHSFIPLGWPVFYLYLSPSPWLFSPL